MHIKDFYLSNEEPHFVNSYGGANGIIKYCKESENDLAKPLKLCI